MVELYVVCSEEDMIKLPSCEDTNAPLKRKHEPLAHTLHSSSQIACISSMSGPGSYCTSPQRNPEIQTVDSLVYRTQDLILPELGINIRK